MTFLQFHTIAALRGDGLRPELKVLLDRLAKNSSEGVARENGMVQSGPDGHTESLRADTAGPMLALCFK